MSTAGNALDPDQEWESAKLSHDWELIETNVLPNIYEVDKTINHADRVKCKRCGVTAIIVDSPTVFSPYKPGGLVFGRCFHHYEGSFPVHYAYGNLHCETISMDRALR